MKFSNGNEVIYLQGGAIEIGTGEQVTKFRFVVQEVPGAPADAVSFDCQKKYRTVATFHSKIQVMLFLIIGYLKFLASLEQLVKLRISDNIQ